MKIVKLSYSLKARDIEVLYDHVNEALKQLDRNHVGKTKIELRKSIRKLESIRAHLRNRGIR